tara:strand:- start:305 stop:481 length:177 start_codon:yes stop_codon:yes gene_type:complete
MHKIPVTGDEKLLTLNGKNLMLSITTGVKNQKADNDALFLGLALKLAYWFKGDISEYD